MKNDIFERVQYCLGQDDYEQAIILLNEAKQNYDTEVEAFRMLGYVFYQLKQFEISIANSTKALSFGTLAFMETNMAHYFRGRAAADNANYALAMTDCWELLKLGEKEKALGDSHPDCNEDAFDIIELVMQADLSTMPNDVKLQIEEILIHFQMLESELYLTGYSPISSMLSKLRQSCGTLQ